MKKAKKIDIIIPAYNVPDNILYRCLASIACQDIIEDLEITIVDDASPEQNYVEVAKKFEPFLKIQILRLEENGGPGVARQAGIDNTSNPYITFIDADDTFVGSFALSTLRRTIELQNTTVICGGTFNEIHEEGLDEPLIVPHEQDMVWMFGKLYKRSFIEKYKIRFHETSRANEDNGFNTICKLCINEQEQIAFLSTVVYNWHENLNSITRQNDYQYTYGGAPTDSFYGYVENMIYAIREAKRRNPYNGTVVMQAVVCMVYIYQYYIECVARAPKHAASNWEQCKRYYQEIYSKFEEDISPEILSQHYNDIMQNAYLKGSMNGIIPCMGIWEFLAKLKEEIT